MRLMLLALCLIAVSCGGSKETLEFDYLGVLLEADTDQWVVDPADGSGTVGGPDSHMTLGPGTFWLSGDQVVSIAPATPGGTVCRGLGGGNVDCVIVGAYATGDSSGWYATLRIGEISPDPVEFRVGRIEALDGLDAIVSIQVGNIALEVSPEARFDCYEPGDISEGRVALPEAFGHVAIVDLDWRIVAIECIDQ